MADAAQGLADLGMVSLALKDDETDKFKSYAIAVDGIGIILESSNSVPNLSDRQIVDIYTGRSITGKSSVVKLKNINGVRLVNQSPTATSRNLSPG